MKDLRIAMKMTDTFENEKVLVLGLAKSGMSACKLLQQLKAIITVNDSQALEENPDARNLLNQGIKVITGGHPRDLLDEDFKFIVKNPGIPYTNPILQEAITRDIPIITEVELALAVNEANLIAITGTNGKTTTTTLIHQIFEQDTHLNHSFIGGNIGIPASDVVQKATTGDQLVLELSSFQLLGTPTIKPEIALITNIYSAHLDYHENRREYVDAKLNITANQTEKDYLVYNADQEELEQLVHLRSKAKLIPFSRKKRFEHGVWTDDKWIYFGQEQIIQNKSIKLIGDHNLENILAAIAVSKLKGVSNEIIQDKLSHFYGVAHRSEFIKEIDGVKYINDSKATNTLATEQALAGVLAPIILICGGLDRGEDFSELAPYVMEKVKALITMGQTAPKLSALGHKSGVKYNFSVDTIQEAVYKAHKISENGDTVLLSPACASWDQYTNFEERGNLFIDEVNKL